MKIKSTLVLALILGTAGTLYSLDGKAGISLGVLGAGFNSATGSTDGCFSGRLITLMYQTDAGFGITASPFVFSEGINNDYSSLTFINASLFYNFFRHTNSFLILGPFVSVNAVNYIDPQFAEFRSGLVFSVRNILREIYYGSNSIFDSDFILIEAGYKYNKTEKHRFFAQVSIDMVAVLMFLGLGSEDRVKEYKENERLR